MELSDYLKFLRPRWWLVIGAGLLVGAAVWTLTLRQAPTYQAAMTVTVEKSQAVPQRATSYYQYDEYYSQASAQIFTDTVADWLRSAAITAAIVDRAGETGTLQVNKRDEATVLTLTARAGTAEGASKLLAASEAILNEQLTRLKTANNDDDYFALVTNPGTPSLRQSDPRLNSLLGFLTGAVAGLVWVLLLASLNARRK